MHMPGVVKHSAHVARGMRTLKILLSSLLLDSALQGALSFGTFTPGNAFCGGCDGVLDFGLSST